MKIANIDQEILHILWTAWGISVNISGKMWLMTILKVTKNRFCSRFRIKGMKSIHTIKITIVFFVFLLNNDGNFFTAR